MSLRLRHGKSIADKKMLNQRMLAREKQLKDAVQYCLDQGCKGYAAIGSGLFPMIKDPRTVNRRLECTPDNKRIETGSEKQHVRILTVNEEERLVKHIRNRNRACMGLARKDVQRIILDMLRIRVRINKKSTTGRKYVKLSRNAAQALRKGYVRRGFWQRFYVQHPDLIRKRPNQWLSHGR